MTVPADRIVRGLAEASPLYVTRGGYACALCHGEGESRATVEHHHTCPWVRARAGHGRTGTTRGGEMNTTSTGDEIVDYTETCPSGCGKLDIDEEMCSCPKCGWSAVFPDWLAAEKGEDI